MIKKLLKNFFRTFVFKNNIEKIEKYLAKSINNYDLENRILEIDLQGKYNQFYI